MMPMPDPAQQTVEQEITRLLAGVERGERAAYDALFPLLYDELRLLARRERRRVHGQQTLNTTALVHEAYLKLVDRAHVSVQSRLHFTATAARAMRHILVDHARNRRRQKRGGGRIALSLDVLDAKDHAAKPESDDPDLLLMLEHALTDLERVNERHARIATCRIFGGMTVEETAAALGISTATVSRGWAVARARLRRALAGEP